MASQDPLGLFGPPDKKAATSSAMGIVGGLALVGLLGLLGFMWFQSRQVVAKPNELDPRAIASNHVPAEAPKEIPERSPNSAFYDTAERVDSMGNSWKRFPHPPAMQFAIKAGGNFTLKYETADQRTTVGPQGIDGSLIKGQLVQPPARIGLR